MLNGGGGASPGVGDFSGSRVAGEWEVFACSRKGGGAKGVYTAISGIFSSYGYIKYTNSHWLTVTLHMLDPVQFRYWGTMSNLGTGQRIKDSQNHHVVVIAPLSPTAPPPPLQAWCW